MHQDISELSFPNIGTLKSKCVAEMQAQPATYVSQKEWEGLQAIVAAYLKEFPEQPGYDWASDPVIKSIQHDIQHAPYTPKWCACVNWLSYSGIVTLKPILVIRLVKAMLERRV